MKVWGISTTMGLFCAETLVLGLAQIAKVFNWFEFILAQWVEFSVTKHELACLWSSNSRGGKVHNLSAPSAENQNTTPTPAFCGDSRHTRCSWPVFASTDKGYPPLISSISPPHLICGFDTRWSVSTSRTSSNFGSKRTLTMCPETNHMLLGTPQLTFTHRKAQTLNCFYFHIVFYIQNYPNIAISNKKRYSSQKRTLMFSHFFGAKHGGKQVKQLLPVAGHIIHRRSRTVRPIWMETVLLDLGASHDRGHPPRKKKVCGSGLIIIIGKKLMVKNLVTSKSLGQLGCSSQIWIRGAPAAVASSWPPGCRTWSRCPGKSAVLMMTWGYIGYIICYSVVISYDLNLHVQKYPSAFCICMNAHVNKW